MAVPNPLRAELGARVRSHREAAGISRAEVEAALDWNAGKAGRLERGTRSVTAEDFGRLLDLLKVPTDQRPELHELAAAARRREAPQQVADFVKPYDAFERKATGIRYFSDSLILGSVTTEEYAAALLATGGLQQDDLASAVEGRMARGEALFKRDPMPTVDLIFGEAVLHRLVGGPAVLRGQLERLLEVSSNPNVTIRIVEYSAGAHALLGLTVNYLSLEAPPIRKVYLEGLTSGVYVTADDEIAYYEQAFSQVKSVAASPDESATIIRRRINQLG